MPTNYLRIISAFFPSRQLVAALLLLLVNGHASAQRSSTDGTTPLGLSPGSPNSSYSLNGFENINYFNGNLSFALPLLTVSGRGGASAPIILRLEQHWRAEDWYYNDTNYHYVQPQHWNREIPTFNPGFMAVRQVGDFYKSCYPYCGDDYGCTYHGTLTRLTFTAPDGTEYEFRDALTDGQPLAPGCADTVGRSRGKVFVSTDGTSAVFTSDQDVRDKLNESSTWLAVSGFLRMSDGSVYRIDGGNVKWLRDRNGNLITFEYDAGYDPASGLDDGESISPRLTKITDSLNRQVIIHYGVNDPQYGLCNQIIFKGFEGASRTISIAYKNLENTLRADQTVKKYNQLFPTFDGPAFGLNDPNTQFNPKKAAAVYLPNGKSYQFHYTSYGELARVDLPTQGWVEYDYDFGVRFIDTGYPRPAHFNDIDTYRRLITRRDAAGSTLVISRPESEEVVFGSPGVSQFFNEGHVDVQQYDRGQPFVLTKHYYYGSAGATLLAAQDAFFYNGWKDGREWKTEVFDRDTAALLRTVEQHWEQRAHVSWWSQFPNHNTDNEPTTDPRVYETITTLADVTPNKITKEVFTYDSDPNIKFNSLTDVRVYDYGDSVAGTSLLRHTHTEYLSYRNLNSGVDYTSEAIHLLNLPLQQSVFGLNSSGSEVELARTTYEYDNYLADNKHAVLKSYSDISGLCTEFSNGNQCANLNPAGYAARGNATAISHWLLSGTGAPAGPPFASYMQYDIAGNMVKAIDPRGNATTFNYTDNFGMPDDNDARNAVPPAEWLINAKGYAYITKVTNALGFTSYAQYDYYAGKKVNVENINGTVTSAYYNNSMGRPTQLVSAANSSTLRSRTKFEYDDALRIVKIYGDQTSDNDQAFHKEIYYDEFGRSYETRVFDDAAVTWQYIASTTSYDSLGRVVQSSNPYRPTLGEAAVYTTTEYDALGRIKRVTMPESQPVVNEYLGNTSLVIDQAGKKRASRTDALGRLTQLIEDPDGFHYVTNYNYDALGNLRKVAQGAQERYFAYDSLNRLVRAKIPEQDTNTNLSLLTDPITNWNQWSAAYSYDASGNPETMTDSRGVVTTNNYDELNRIKTITYTNDPANTAPIAYTYDASGVANSKGRLTSASSGISTYNYTEYDALGRIKASAQVTDGQTYAMSYGYDLAGELTSQTYPSGRVVTTTYDVAGRIAALNGQQSSQATPYLSAFKYWSSGAVKQVQLGNGLNEHLLFNHRLQPLTIALGTSATDASLMRLDYGYGVLDEHGVLDTTRNNGNVQSQSITVPGLAQPIVQTYTYDALNRLSVAQENGGASWQQTFGYDQYGNRSLDVAATTAEVLGDNPQINPSTNRILPRADEHYHYDAAGNLDVDKTGTPLGYDASGHLVAFNGGATLSTGGMSYYFDALGQRVKKASYYNSTVYVYDAFGKQVAEYTTAAQTGAGGTTYLTTDALGTPRVLTDASGRVRARHDYLPFGEEIGGPHISLQGGRTPQQQYVSDSLRQQFTGQERDRESGLDYFKARAYASQQGRFTSVDPLLASGRPGNPQSFNRYAYALNNPLRFGDPLGLDPSEGDSNDPFKTGQEEKKKTFSGTGCDAGTPGCGNAFNFSVTVTADPQSSTIETTAVELSGATLALRPLLPLLSAGGEAVGATSLAIPAAMAGGFVIANGLIGAIDNPRQAANHGPDGISISCTSGTQAWPVPIPLAPPSPDGPEGAVPLYHGSINDATQILATGLDPSRGPTWVTRDPLAAANAISPGRYQVSQGLARDSGIITSMIPRTLFNQHFAPFENPHGVYRGFGGGLSSSEIILRTPVQFQIFNTYIVR